MLTYSDGTTSTVTQSISDWGLASGYPGETIAFSSAYRVQPNGTPQTGPWIVYGYSFPVNPAKTLSSITLPNNRNVVVFAMTLSSTTPISSSTLLSSYQAAASMSQVDNVYAITGIGAQPVNGGFDNAGYAFPASQLPNPFAWNGSLFTFGNPGVPDAASSTTVPLPLGSFSSLQMLASGAFGTQTNQPFVLTYSDGTTATLTQSISDWGYPSAYAGEGRSTRHPESRRPGWIARRRPVDHLRLLVPRQSGKNAHQHHPAQESECGGFCHNAFVERGQQHCFARASAGAWPERDDAGSPAPCRFYRDGDLHRSGAAPGRNVHDPGRGHHHHHLVHNSAGHLPDHGDGCVGHFDLGDDVHAAGE